MMRMVSLALAGIIVFALVALVMVRVMPQPMKDTDYVIAGSVATLVALGVVFLTFVSTSRSRDVFFKKRKK